MTDTLPPLKRSDLLAAIVLFGVVNLALVGINGVRLGGDSPMYIDGASRMLAGEPLRDREPSYAGYIAVVAAATASGAGTFGVVMLQVLFGSIAAAAVYAIGVALAGRVAGAIAAVLYAFDVDTNRWHQFILAESIYVSLFIIGVLLTYRAAFRKGFEPIATATVVLIAAGFVRPEGWFVIPAAACYVIWMRARSAAQRLAGAGALVGAALIVAAIMAPSLSGNLQAVGPAHMLQRGQTIWEYDGWRVDMPANEAAGSGQVDAAAGYALRHPISTMQLMVARIAVHFAHVRPFYSTPHNIVIVLWLVPVYAAAALAMWRLRSSPLAMWVIAAIGTQTLVVALTHAEWDGRYLAHVLPLIYTLTGAGVVMVLDRPSLARQAHA